MRNGALAGASVLSATLQLICISSLFVAAARQWSGNVTWKIFQSFAAL